MYGPLPPRRLPQQNAERVRLVADRWWRASMAATDWATQAKECVDFFEGRQWTEAQKQSLRDQGRSAVTFNKIGRLVRLVAGYMRNNRTDLSFPPANEGPANEATSEVLGRIAKQISEANQLPWVDAEVFLDGIVTGRGYLDQRLSFEDNDLGEVCIKAVDPFTVFVDPDCEDYDISKAKHITVTRWASLDDIEFTYGPAAAEAVRPFIGTTGANSWGGFPYLDMNGPEITPVRTFGEVEDPNLAPFADFFHTELLDRTRKMVRVLDQQHTVVRWGPVFIDLETGDKVPVPSNWGRREIEKAIWHAQQIGNPVVVDRRPIRRIRWTVLVGDTVVHDDWSPYDNYTITGYFPYFRRGKTRGLVEDLLDPQREVNKRRSSEIDIVTRTSNTGWLVHKDAVAPEDMVDWKNNAAKPGFVGRWQGEKEPKRIDAAPPPTAMERLEDKARNDILEISGVNESAFGELDRVQSGRAIEARQRQAVIAIQVYMDNFARSKELVGRRMLEIVQRHYTEERVFRIIGEDGRLAQFVINQAVVGADGSVSSRLNDITLGKYNVAVDETPLSASFANAQFEEMLMLLEKMGPLGAMLMQTRPDLVIDLSSLPRKDEWMEVLRGLAQQQQAQQQAEAAMAAGGGPVVAPGGGPAPSIDAGTAPGSRVVPVQG